MVKEFESNTQNTNKTQLLATTIQYILSASCLWEFRIVPQNGPSTQLIDAMSCVKMWNATIGAEELSYISISNVVSGQKLEKLLINHEAWYISWRILSFRCGKQITYWCPIIEKQWFGVGVSYVAFDIKFPPAK